MEQSQPCTHEEISQQTANDDSSNQTKQAMIMTEVQWRLYSLVIYNVYQR